MDMYKFLFYLTLPTAIIMTVTSFVFLFKYFNEKRKVRKAEERFNKLKFQVDNYPGGKIYEV